MVKVGDKIKINNEVEKEFTVVGTKNTYYLGGN